MPAQAPTYLDYNATAPVKPGVADAMTAALAVGGNPSSVHRAGRAARRLVEESRRRLAVAVGARPANIVFTSGGTEANRLALQSRPRVLASAVEHPSVAALVRRKDHIPVDGAGRLDLSELEAALSAGNGEETLVSVMLANNETGVVQPVEAAAALAHAYGALLHCDAVQGLGKVPLDLAALHTDLLSVSAHKIGGPAGVGALVLRSGLALAANRGIGGQEQGRRPGTENLTGIAGFGAALKTLENDLADRPRQAALRRRMEAALAGEAVFFGHQAERLANTTCIAMPAVPAETQVMAFDLAGFCVSAGAACSSGKVQASPVLAAMGVADDLARCAIRVSIGPTTTEAEIDAFAQAWQRLCTRKRTARLT